MYATKHIDWLSITIPKHHDFRSVLPTLTFALFAKGRHGYEHQFVNVATGILVDTDSNDTEMGHHFTMSGDTLANIRREMGGDDVSLVRRFARYSGRASRIDLTLNIHEGLLTPAKVYSHLKKGTLHAKANTYRFIEGKKGDIAGDTLYIGSPTADRQFRCYNKASESGIVNLGAWIRFELELRRVRANGAFQSIGINGVDDTVVGHLRDFMEYGQPEYEQALSITGAPPVDVPRKATNRQRWLLGQVASALAKEMVLDREFANKFWQATLEEMRLITKT
jgi:hypothetical protein